MDMLAGISKLCTCRDVMTTAGRLEMQPPIKERSSDKILILTRTTQNHNDGLLQCLRQIF